MTEQKKMIFKPSSWRTSRDGTEEDSRGPAGTEQKKTPDNGAEEDSRGPARTEQKKTPEDRAEEEIRGRS